MAENTKNGKKKGRTSRVVLTVLSVILIVLAVAAVVLLTHRKPDPRSGEEPNFDFTEEETSEDEAGEEDPVDPDAPTVNEEAAQESLETVEHYEVPKDEGWKHYLLLGIDGHSYKGRSDAMLVLSVNKDAQRVLLSSVPRDTFVYVEGKGFSKLSHAYSYGGADLAVQTYEENFDIDIEHYFVVNFDSLPQIVDLVGGVTLTLTDAEAEHMGKQYAAWGLSGGTQKLDGKEVLAYCRVRKIDSDYKRNERQFKALMAIYEEVKNLSYDEYVKLAKIAYDSMYSDMMVGDMLLLLKDVMDISKVSAIENVKLVDRENSKSGNYAGASVVMVDNLVEVAKRWREMLGVEEYIPSGRIKQISKQLDKTLGR